MNTETREPFDLERALTGDAVETRQGLKVTDLKFFENAKAPHKLSGVIHSQEPFLGSWTKNGYYSSKEDEYKDDLFMSPKPKVIRYLWANKDGSYARRMLTEEEAKKHLFDQGYTIKLEWSATEFPV